MASSMTFRPHGLIRTPMQQQFYNKAHIANIYTGIADPKEHDTVALMEVVLYKNIFTEDYFAVTSEQLASPTSKRQCDLVVKYLDSGCENIRTLCFAECKRTNKSQAFSLRALETQAADYCKLYLEHEKVPFVYAATMAGAHVRLWKCELGTQSLIPFWGSNSQGDWQEYKDIGDEEAGRLVENTFNDMKAWPPTPHAGQTSSSYASYQPANTLPANSNPYNKPAEASDRYTVSYPTQAGLSGYAVTQTYATGLSTYPTYPTQADPSGYRVPQTYATGPSTYSSQAGPSEYAVPQTTTGPSKEDAKPDTGAWNQYTSQPSTTEPEWVAETSREGEYMVVRVTKVSHMTRADEFIFHDQRGHQRFTTKSDWTKTRYSGKTAWLYQGRKMTYVTYDKIPS